MVVKEYIREKEEAWKGVVKGRRIMVSGSGG